MQRSHGHTSLKRKPLSAQSKPDEHLSKSPHVFDNAMRTEPGRASASRFKSGIGWLPQPIESRILATQRKPTHFTKIKLGSVLVCPTPEDFDSEQTRVSHSGLSDPNCGRTRVRANAVTGGSSLMVLCKATSRTDAREQLQSTGFIESGFGSRVCPSRIDNVRDWAHQSHTP